MNNSLKGAIGAAAGVALLLGGAGTFAMWNTTTSTDPATINTGQLSLAEATGTWKHGGATIDLSSFHLVPGDVITYTVPLTITATGDDLKAKLTVDSGSISGLTTSGDVTVATALSSGGSGVTIDQTDHKSATITAPASGDYTVDATVTVTFTDVKDKAEQKLALTLEPVKFDLNQTA